MNQENVLNSSRSLLSSDLVLTRMNIDYIIDYMKYDRPDYNSQSIRYFAPTLAQSLGAPTGGFKLNPDALFAESFGDVEKAIIFHPTAMGVSFINSFPEVFEPLREKVLERIDVLTQYPTEKAVCLTSAYTGATMEEHGVRDKTYKVGCFSLFDALASVGKKCALVTPKKSGYDFIFSERPLDIFTVEQDIEAINKALNLIKGNEYDYIAVVNSDYEDMMRVSGPLSKESKKVAEVEVKAFCLLCDAASVYWKEPCLVGFCPDRGAHKTLFGGKSGSANASDMNVTHFFGRIR